VGRLGIFTLICVTGCGSGNHGESPDASAPIYCGNFFESGCEPGCTQPPGTVCVCKMDGMCGLFGVSHPVWCCTAPGDMAFARDCCDYGGNCGFFDPYQFSCMSQGSTFDCTCSLGAGKPIDCGSGYKGKVCDPYGPPDLQFPNCCDITSCGNWSKLPTCIAPNGHKGQCWCSAGDSVMCQEIGVAEIIDCNPPDGGGVD
jgi:hypothetical protein